MARKNNRFDRAGCYKCKMCGKLTRETGNQESSVEMCYKCDIDSGQENAHVDGVHDKTPAPGCYICEKRPPNWELPAKGKS